MTYRGTFKYCVAIVVSVGLIGLGRANAQTSITGAWVSQDIGQPAITGNATGDGSSFTITAGGEDIWGTSDQFHFVYEPVSGDVDIRARVDRITNADRWSKAGVMIRSSLAANAAHGFALVSVAKGTAFQRRTSTGGSSIHTAGPFVAAPRWVRLVKSGSTVTAYQSADGSSWSVIGTSSIQFGSTVYVGIAVTSHNPGSATTASVSQIAVSAAAASTTLPTGQSQRDIGSPAIKGNGSYSSGTYTIKAAGRDIWDTSDQFHYVYKQATGDIDTSVRIASLGYSNSWAKAGVMIRETLGAGSAHGFAFVTPGSGYAFQGRPSTGALTEHVVGVSGKAPGWVRLRRNGDLFTAYQSTDGTNWRVIGSDTIPMAATVYVGIAVTSHNASVSTTAKADHFKVGASSGGNQPPTVALTSPSNGASFTAPATITLTASASDPENQLSKVEFYAGSTRLATDTAAPFTFSWTSIVAGSYALKAKAYDAAGAVTTSSTVSITVSGTLALPTGIAFQASADHATVTSYRLDIFAPGANPSTATPVATKSLGKPTPNSSNTITVTTLSTFFSALVPGSYQATVSAVNSGGIGRSAPISFTR
jgi:regulation of enolase protein 1 (concanavalin A-like superfamily)